MVVWLRRRGMKTLWTRVYSAPPTAKFSAEREVLYGGRSD